MTKPIDISSIGDEISSVGRGLNLSSHDIYQEFLDFIVGRTSSSIGYLHLFNESHGEIQLNVWSSGVHAGCTTSADSHYPLAIAGIWADAIRQRQTVVHNDYATAKAKKGLPTGHFELIRHMSTPIVSDDRVVAIIGVGNKDSHYTDRCIRHFEAMSNLAWREISDRLGAISLQRTIRDETFSVMKSDDLFVGFVEAISKASELRDEYTIHHQEKVSLLAVSIARELSLPEDQIYGIRLGSLIHDIGKIALPAEILSKIGRLNAAEIGLIRTHPSLGAEIFKNLKSPWPLREIIEQHHERIDGSGYPKGLTGPQISLEARIVAVADVFDAMASDRPYRHALGIDAAIRTIMEGRGVLFDPYVVDAFMTTVRSKVLPIDKIYGARDDRRP